MTLSVAGVSFINYIPHAWRDQTILSTRRLQFTNKRDRPGQVPICIIIDTLDKCPDTAAGAPSDHNEVLDFVDDLVRSKRPSLYIYVTSRPEQDAQSTLKRRRVSPHEEGKQKKISTLISTLISDILSIQTE